VELYPENLDAVLLFLEALPAWRTTGMDRIAEGFDRSEVVALMDLRGTQDRQAGWVALRDLEGELAVIRASERDKGKHTHG
jgi:hypothetical protein